MTASKSLCYRVVGGKTLSGTVTTNISKNAAVALLAASLLNKGKTVLKRMPRIEEVKRLVEVLESIGVAVSWEGEEMTITPPARFNLKALNTEAAKKTRSIALFLAPLAHALGSFTLPQPGGCRLGVRTMAPHVMALKKLGIDISVNEDGAFRVHSHRKRSNEVVLYEASDTATENVLMAAALIPGETTIKFASANYMVQDLCAFLEACGVRIEGIGTSTLVVHGIADINKKITGHPSEDPIESMFFISLAATTKSKLTIRRCPIDFLELELITLEAMGLRYKRSAVYKADNKLTNLVDITMHPSELIAPIEKIAPRPYPGINIDNLPFFVPIATQAKGRTLIHDWVYENRATYYLEMAKLGADLVFADPHRVYVEGSTEFQPAEMIAPPALRPATIILIGMLAADGESLLRNVYPINRGYEDLHERLAALGAQIEVVQ